MTLRLPPHTGQSPRQSETAEGFHRQGQIGLAPEEPRDVQDVPLVEVHFQVVPPELDLPLATVGLRDELKVDHGLDARHEGLEAPAAQEGRGRLEPPGDRHLFPEPLDEEVDGVEGPGRVRKNSPEGRRIEEPEAVVRDL